MFVRVCLLVCLVVHKRGPLRSHIFVCCACVCAVLNAQISVSDRVLPVHRIVFCVLSLAVCSLCLVCFFVCPLLVFDCANVHVMFVFMLFVLAFRLFVS